MQARYKKNKLGALLIKQLQILVVIVLLGVVFIIVRGIYFRVQDERAINKSIKALQSDVKKFDQENKDLNKLVNYFNSVEFQEKEIKEKLNLVKNGEKIVFIQGSRSNEDNVDREQRQDENKVVTIHDYYYYWWQYFFGGGI